MRGGWIVTLGLLGGCTAPNPAFGDATGGTGGTSKAEETSAKPTSEPTLDPTRDTTTDDPTRAESSSDAQTTTPVDTGSMSGTTQPMTSDDDTSTPTTSTDEGSSDVGDPAADVLLYTAAMNSGQLSMDGPAAAIQIGAMMCADAFEQLGLDACGGTHHALIRIGAMPFGAPALVANLGHGVSSVEGEPIAETLQDFFDGNWLVPALTTVGAGGLDELDGTPLVTGGSSNEDVNCAGWTTENGEMTLGDVDAGGGWFSAGEIGCATPARMLCLCLP